MTRPDHHRRPSWWQGRSTPILAGVAVALVWVVLAWMRPTTTWHLAPLLVVLAPLWAAEQVELPRRPTARLAWVAAGTVLALVATVALQIAGMLAGPVLFGSVAWVEATFIVSAGGIGAVGWILRVQHRAASDR